MITELQIFMICVIGIIAFDRILFYKIYKQLKEFEKRLN